MPVPTVEWWQQKTSATFSNRKNPLITDIDILLREYHTAGKTEIQKQKLLILILYYCEHWLSAKGEKQNSWRRPFVVVLETAVENELRSAEMVNAKDRRVQGDAGRGVHVKENPVEIMQPRNAQDKFGLRAELNLERASAGDVEAFIKRFGRNTHLTGYARELQREMRGGDGAPDYVDSLKIIAVGKARGNDVGRNLSYLSKQERLRRQISLWPDQCFHLNGADPVYDTRDQTFDDGVPRTPDIFAMDTMELIYIGDGAPGKFHHSSFLSGKPVLCAGELLFTAGKIRFISNGSGHYMPSTRDLLSCVSILQRKYGVDLQQVKVKDQATEHVWNSAADFLARGGVVWEFQARGGRPPQRAALGRTRGVGNGV